MRNGNRVDLTKLARSLDVRRVLTDLGIPFKDRRDGTELMLRCINPDHDDASGDSLHMNARSDEYNGLWKCNPCGWRGNVYKYLVNASENSFSEIINFLKEYGTASYVGSNEAVILDRQQALESKSVHVEDDAPLPYLPVPLIPFPYRGEWDNDHAAQLYLSSRRIHPIVAFNYGVGYNDSFPYKTDPKLVTAKKSIVFPIYHGGQTVSYFLRRYPSEETFWGDLKKLFPTSAVIAKTLYGIDQCVRGRPTVVVEGIIDALVVSSALLVSDNNEYNVVAAYSNNATKFHVDQLRNLECSVVVMPDRDGAPGTVLCESIGRPLYHERDIYIANIPWGKDPGDCSCDEIVHALANKEVWIEHTTKNTIFTGKPYVIGF